MFLPVLHSGLLRNGNLLSACGLPVHRIEKMIYRVVLKHDHLSLRSR